FRGAGGAGAGTGGKEGRGGMTRQVVLWVVFAGLLPGICLGLLSRWPARRAPEPVVDAAQADVLAPGWVVWIRHDPAHPAPADLRVEATDNPSRRLFKATFRDREQAARALRAVNEAVWREVRAAREE